MAVAHLAESAEMCHIDQIVVELHHMLETGARGRECVLKVDEGLLRLGTEVARLAHDLVVDVEAELACNVDDPARARGLDHMSVPGWLCDGGRVLKAMNGH